MVPPSTTIAQLPHDLLAHVLRFVTESVRRDGQSPRCTSLADWRYASVSSAFRRAFLKNISSLLLEGSPALALAELDWISLDPCTAIRRVEIAPALRLTDIHLARLFRRLRRNHCPIRQFDISLDRNVTALTLLTLANVFGPHVTHLAIRVPWNRRTRRRRDHQLVFHGHEANFPFDGNLHAGPLPAPGVGFPEEDPDPQFPPILPNPHLHQGFEGVIHIINGVPVLPQHAFHNLDQVMANHLEAGQGFQDVLNEYEANLINPIPQENGQMMEVVDNALLNVFQALENLDNNNPVPMNIAGEPNAAAPQIPIANNQPNVNAGNHPPNGNLADMVHIPFVVNGNGNDPMPGQVNLPNPQIPMQPANLNPFNLNHVHHPAGPSNAPGPGNAPLLPNPNPANVANLLNDPNPPPAGNAVPPMHAQLVPGHGAQQQHTLTLRTTSSGNPLPDDTLASTLSKMPALKELVIEHVRTLNSGIMPLIHCAGLESLSIISCPSIAHGTIKKLLASTTKLRELRLTELPAVGNAAISALCNGPSRSTLRVLHLSKMSKITDPSIRLLVNSCENIEYVHISDCHRITCDAASHLSCAQRLTDLYFKPQPEFPLLNRTSIHLSCAASTLRSLELVGCKNLSLDGIVALGNLPSLQKLHLLGLGHISQDVMRQLGVFPKLDDLTLEGPMYLTDLGVKVLCGQRGHRFLYLALIDTTRNLTEEALDCIMTWCISLRSLEIHGQFNQGAIDRLREFIPNASLTVSSNVGGKQHKHGFGGVWDPLRNP